MFRGMSLLLRGRSAVASAVVVGLLFTVAVPPAFAQSPRFGSPAWYGASNARRGSATSDAPGGSRPTTSIAPNNPAGASGVTRSLADFTQAARAIAQAQAAQAQAVQAQAVQAAQASRAGLTQAGSNAVGKGPQRTVPDGLTPGGLVANAGLWSGAATPTAARSAGATGAAGNTGGTIVTVNQTAQTADLTWNSFNVGANTTLRFAQGGSNWTVLNRVRDPTAAPSLILGAISAPGEVLVLNANGILFGAGSQVNVGALVASTANLAAAQFSTILSAQNSSGAWLPAFIGATAPVTVEAGAAITTNTASGGQSGGFVLLMGQSVSNAGRITTPNGQTVLAGGQNFVLRPGYSAANNPTSTTQGLEVAATGAGIVTNTGLIQAATGDITLAGQTLLQAGVLLSSTTVGQRGTIHLLTNATDAGASITFAPGSLTAVQPLDDGTTATNTARANLIAQSSANNLSRATASLLGNQVAMPDQQYQSRIEIVSGGTVEFQNNSLNLSTGGQIAIYAAGRALADTGAALSAAGSVDSVLPASANILSARFQPFDLRDAPANRDTGALTTQVMNVATDSLVQIGDLQYTKGGLLEVRGYVAGLGHTIGEWTSVGGSISLNASEIVAQPGASFNISGGLVTYAAGNVANTWLTGSDGKLYNVNSAPANLTYTGIYNGFTVSQPRWGVSETFNSPLIAPATTYKAAYTVGRDAGTLTIDAPTTILEATTAAGVSAGEFQNGVRPSGSFDPFALAQSVAPLPGTLIVIPIDPVSVGKAIPVIAGTDVTVTRNGQPLAASLDLSTPVPGDRVGTAILSASLLNDAALGGLTVVTRGAIRVDAPLTLADGGIVSLLAPAATLSSSLTARGGQVTVGGFDAGQRYTAAPFFLDARDSGGNAVPSSVALTSGATIDTRGVFSNLAIDPATSEGTAFVNGGPVTIDSSGSVMLAAGSTIDASAGGAVLANRSTRGGNGGAISITAYDPNDTNLPVTSGPGTSQQVIIGATLRALGSGAVPCASCLGGALTLNVPAVAIGARTTDAATVVLVPDFFASGFSSYTIVGQNGVTVADNTRIAVVQPIHQFTAATALIPGGVDPATAFTVGLPALYTPNPATAVITQRAGASLTLRAGTIVLTSGGISLGTGSAITVDPSQTIGLEAQGQITINGTLTAPSGTIRVVNDQYLGTSNSLSVFLGGASVLDVSARNVTALDGSGGVFGTVPNGGTIQIGGQGGTDASGNAKTTNAFIIVQPGAVLSAAGTAATIDPTAGQSLTVSAVGTFVVGALLERLPADRKSTRLNSSHPSKSRMPSSA